MNENDFISYMREMTRFEILLWRLHTWFGYLAYKSMFGETSAKRWRQDMLDVLEKVPTREFYV